MGRRTNVANITPTERRTILAILERNIAENPNVKTTHLMDEMRAAGIKHGAESVNRMRLEKYGARLRKPSIDDRNKIIDLIKEALRDDPTTPDKELVQLAAKAGYIVNLHWVSRWRRISIGRKRPHTHQDASDASNQQN